MSQSEEILRQWMLGDPAAPTSTQQRPKPLPSSLSQSEFRLLEQQTDTLLPRLINEHEHCQHSKWDTWMHEQITHAKQSLAMELSADDLLDMVKGILVENRSNEQIQNALFEIVPDFDLVLALLSHRSELMECIQWNKTNRSLDHLGYEENAFLSSLNINATAPSARSRNIDPVASLETQVKQLQKSEEYYYTTLQDKITLPRGSVRITEDGFESVAVPAPEPTFVDPTTLRKISSIPSPLASLVFRNISELNPIQSAVYPCAYGSDENMLVCAPTGAGKTNVALLCVLREVEKHYNPKTNKVNLHAFKIVYVAPMKALAAEVTEKFGAALQKIGITVRELSGDMQLTRSEIRNTQIIVTTPEKWDVISRKNVGSAAELTSCLRLLLIDEVHLLHDDRGAVLESIVARTLRAVESEQRVIRMVALSATLPNYRDVAKFLRVHEDKGLFFFNSSFRPVPLKQEFIGVSVKDAKKKEFLTANLTYRRVRDSLLAGNQVMVFVHARKQTSSCARDLLEHAIMDAGGPMPKGMRSDKSRKYGDKEGFGNGGKKSKEPFTIPPPAAAAAAAATSSGKSAATGNTPAGAGASVGASVFLPKLDGPDRYELGGQERGIPTWASKHIQSMKSGDLRELALKGIGIHHAGLLRHDRKLVESLFAQGVLTVIVCTATLAWGVNLPAHTVVIRGTQIYEPTKGGFVELSMLDVMQIFGRAGRPQFDTLGEGIIITTHDKLSHYLRMLTSSLPIESRLLDVMSDHVNAEIVAGSVRSIIDAANWLNYTYFAVRMVQNPLAYGASWEEVAEDPSLGARQQRLVEDAARELDEAKMIRYNDQTGELVSTDLGRIASHWYISHATVVKWNAMLKSDASEADLLYAVAQASEFEAMRVREEEVEEILKLKNSVAFIPLPPRISLDGKEAKVIILIQALISKKPIISFSLQSDQNGVRQNCPRLLRAIMEIALRRGWPQCASIALELSRALDHCVWPFQSPLRQLIPFHFVHAEICGALEQAGQDDSVDLLDLESLIRVPVDDMKNIVGSEVVAKKVIRAARAIPRLKLIARVSPISRSVLRLQLEIQGAFDWSEKLSGSDVTSKMISSKSANASVAESNGNGENGTTGMSTSSSSSDRAGVSEPFILWVEDGEEERIYHVERISLSRKTVKEKGSLFLDLMIPVFDPPSESYLVRSMSDRWHGGDTCLEIRAENMKLPDKEEVFTPLLDLRPLSVNTLRFQKRTALTDPRSIALRAKLSSPELDWSRHFNFSFFNPIQTQIFHSLYHTDENVLVGAVTGSGKTTMCELVALRALLQSPGSLVVYIAPLESLAKERYKVWSKRLTASCGFRIFHLDTELPASKLNAILNRVHIVTTTPKHWDVVSRLWSHRKFMDRVSAIVLDELHLLGSDNGDVLEAVVSRARNMQKQLPSSGERNVRIVALSTSLASPVNMSDWLGVQPGTGLYNFRSMVRPVSCEVHIQSIPDTGYTGGFTARMLSMNRLVYSSILRHDEGRPILVFVPSRRETHVTASELIKLAAADGNARRFVLPYLEVAVNTSSVEDVALSNLLEFGIGIYHPGLAESDRVLVQHLFTNELIRVLIVNSTQAWGASWPAHLVIVKGTEAFSSQKQAYQELPLTDVLQMVGLAGRPHVDTSACAVVITVESRKSMYKKFLGEALPVESSLNRKLADYLNAEIAHGPVKCWNDAVSYLSSTYLYQRLRANPSFYCVDMNADSNLPLADFILRNALKELEIAGCVIVDGGRNLKPLSKSHGSKKTIVFEDSKEQSADQVDSMNADLMNIPIVSTFAGSIAAYYCVSVKSISLLLPKLKRHMTVFELFQCLTCCDELDVSVRHNETPLLDSMQVRLESLLGEELAKQMGLGSSSKALSVWVLKARVLLLCLLFNFDLSLRDFVYDLRSILENSRKLTSGLVDLSAELTNVQTARSAIMLAQMLASGSLPESMSSSSSLRFSEIDCSYLFRLESKELRECLRKQGLGSHASIANQLMAMPDNTKEQVWKPKLGKFWNQVNFLVSRMPCLVQAKVEVVASSTLKCELEFRLADSEMENSRFRPGSVDWTDANTWYIIACTADKDSKDVKTRVLGMKRIHAHSKSAGGSSEPNRGSQLDIEIPLSWSIEEDIKPLTVEVHIMNHCFAGIGQRLECPS